MTNSATAPTLTIPTLKLELAFQVRLFFKERLRFSPTTPMGGRVYVPPDGGEIWGPRLQGRVIPSSGADWARGRQDGCGELNAHYMLEASDGTPIYIYNRGYLYPRHEDNLPLTPQERAQRVANGEDPFAVWPNTYFVIAPVFDVPVGPHDWLTRTVILGRGDRQPEPPHTVFTYYTVQP